ncbi:MAG TPA: hypothetical protein DEQ30_07015 [Porphyromonadaceae bacterium]|nr:hypothetical protein [Porphyromonadaceae bacterium]
MSMRIKLLFLLCILLSACGNHKEQNMARVLTIDPEIADERSIDMTGRVDSVRFIQLETSPDNLIGMVTTVFFVADKIVVADKRFGRVYLFDTTGKFLSQIGYRGRGPKEYIDMSSVMVNEKERTVIIYDAINKRILAYAVDGGEFRYAIDDFTPENGFIREMTVLPDGNFLCASFDMTPTRIDEKYTGLWMADPQGNFIKNFFPNLVTYPFMLTPANSYFQVLKGGGIGIRYGIHNDLYHFESDSVFLYMQYEIKNDKLPLLAGREQSGDIAITWSTSSQEKGDYIVTKWLSDRNTEFFTVYSLEEEELMTGQVLDYSGTGLPIVSHWFIDSNDPNVLMSALNGVKVHSTLNDPQTPEIAKETLRTFTEGMTEEDILNMNPILQLVYLK